MIRSAGPALIHLLPASALAVCLAGALAMFLASTAHAQNSDLPVIGITISQLVVYEGDDAVFTLTRTGDTSQQLTVEVGTYYHQQRSNTFQVHSVTFEASSGTAPLTVTVEHDGKLETLDYLNAEIISDGNSPYRIENTNTGSAGVSVQDRLVTISASPASMTEGETATFTLTRPGSTDEKLVVNISVSDPGSFLRGDHWEPGPVLPTEVEFVTGSSTAPFTLDTKDDRRDIANNTLTVTVENGTDYHPGSPASASVNVTDNDTAPELELSVGQESIEEGESTDITVSRVGTDTTAAVDIVVESGFRGQLKKSYTGIDAGSSDIVFTVRTDDNDLDEADRVYEFNLLRYPEGYGADVQDEYWTVKGSSTATIAVTDNDLPVLGVEAIAESRNEGESVAFRVVREGDITTDLNIYLEFSEVTHVVDRSAYPFARNLSTWIYEGNTSLVKSYLAESGDGDEPEGLLTARIPPDPTYRIDPARATASTRIIDTDPPPTISVADTSASEGDGTIDFAVTLSAASGREVTVDAYVRDGTAVGGSDYKLAEGVLVFQPGQASRTITVPLIDDNLSEPDETLTLTLDNPSNAVLSDSQTSITVTGTIEDDEPVVSIAASKSQISEGETAMFDLTRTGNTGEALTVPLLVVSSGLAATLARNQEATFPAGETTTTWKHPTVDDAYYGVDGRIVVTVPSPHQLDPPQPATYRVDAADARVTVKDNDLPTVTIVPDHHDRTEGQDVTFTLTRRGNPTSPLTVKVSVTGGDTFITGTRPTTVQFPVGRHTTSLTLNTENDPGEDEHAIVRVEITADPGYTAGNPGSAEVTLFDTLRTYPSVSIRADKSVVTEGDNAAFTLTRSVYQLGQALTVQVQVQETRWNDNLQDSAPDPYTGNYYQRTTVSDLEVEFAANSRTATLARATEDETLNDGNSRVRVAIKLGPYTLTPGPAAAEVWVRDDDIPTVTVDTAYSARVDNEGVPDPIRDETGVPSSRPFAGTGFSDWTETLTQWPGVVLSRTGDTTNTLQIRGHSYSIARWDQSVFVHTGGILVDGNVLESTGFYQATPTIEEALAGDLLPPAGSTDQVYRPAIYPGDAITFNYRPPWLIGPLGGAVYNVINPYYCEEVPGDCGYSPQYRVGESNVAKYRMHNSAQGVRVEAGPGPATEGDDVTFTLHRYGGKTGDLFYPITVKVLVTQEGQFIDGTPPQEVTFAGSPDVITSEARLGELTKTITIATDDDGLDEADGAITLTIVPLTGDEVAEAIRIYEPEEGNEFSDWSSTAAVQVLDNDEMGYSISDASGREKTGSLEFTVTLPAASTLETNVDWATAAATGDDHPNPATEGVDYEAASGTLTFAAGDTSKTVTVTVLNDHFNEENETFLVQLTNPVGATLTDPTGTGTIDDDDLTQTVFVFPVTELVEEGRDAAFRIERRALLDGIPFSPGPENPGDRVVLELAVDQTGDFLGVPLPTTVVFESGDWGDRIVRVPTVDDDAFEADGSVKLWVDNASPPALKTNPEVSRATVDVWDNDIGLSVADADASEEDGTITFKVSLKEAAAREVTVDVATVDGTATSHGVVTATDFGKDFEAKSTTLTFAEGEQEKEFNVTLLEDKWDEEVETFTVELSNPAGGRLQDASATGTVRDHNEYLVARLIPPSKRRIPEDTDQPVRFRVSLSHGTTAASERNVQVEWRVTPGTATHGDDYVESAGILRFPPGHTNGFFEVHMVDDSLFEAKTEDFMVQLLDRRTADSKTKRVDLHATEHSTTIHIRDTDQLAAAISADAETVAEGGDATFTVRLAGAKATAAVSVEYATEGTATSGVDYTAPSGALTIPVGQTSGIISIATLEDSEADPDETLMLKIAKATSLERPVVRKGGTASVTILDSGAESISVGPVPTTDEGTVAAAEAAEGEDLQFQVKLSQATNAPVTVTWETRKYTEDASADGTATPDVDYTTASGTTTIAAGSTSATFTVATTQDTVAEPDELLRVALTGATRAVDAGTPEAVPMGVFSALGKILDDDDPPTGVTLMVSPSSVAEGADETALTVTATLDGDSTLPVATTVPVNIADGTADREDYKATTATITIPAEQSRATGTLKLTPLNDTISEGDETVKVAGTAGELTVSPAEVTITDDDDPPTGVILSVVPDTVAEDGGETTLAVTATLDGGNPLAADTPVPVTVSDGTAGSDDYTATTATITIPARQSSANGTLNLTPVDDSISEGAETVQVTGAAGDLTVSPVEVTITDNDSAPTGIELSVTPTEVAVSIPS